MGFLKKKKFFEYLHTCNIYVFKLIQILLSLSFLMFLRANEPQITRGGDPDPHTRTNPPSSYVVKGSVCGGGSAISGPFLLRSLCVSSEESKFTETQRDGGKRRESEGK